MPGAFLGSGDTIANKTVSALLDFVSLMGNLLVNNNNEEQYYVWSP